MAASWHLHTFSSPPPPNSQLKVLHGTLFIFQYETKTLINLSSHQTDKSATQALSHLVREVARREVVEQEVDLVLQVVRGHHTFRLLPVSCDQESVNVGCVDGWCLKPKTYSFHTMPQKLSY